MENDSPVPGELVRLDDLSIRGRSRRTFMAQATAGGLSVFALSLLTEQEAAAQEAMPQAAVRAENADKIAEDLVEVRLRINGQEEVLKLDPRVTLLDALREHLQTTGTKKGCDHGQCGACTVMIDGRRVLSCLTLAVTCEGREVTTIEGLGSEGQLHPMQQAFIDHDAFQCGYCTPGQICSAVALLKEAEEGQASYVTDDLDSAGGDLSDDEIRERMSGNICRCGAYPNIVKAVAEVQSGRLSAQTWNFHIKVDEVQA